MDRIVKKTFYTAANAMQENCIVSLAFRYRTGLSKIFIAPLTNELLIKKPWQICLKRFPEKLHIFV